MKKKDGIAKKIQEKKKQTKKEFAQQTRLFLRTVKIKIR